MKGLLLKDFYNLSRMGKQYLVIFAAMGVWAYFMDNPTIVSMYVVLCSSMLVLSSFSYDEYAKFEKYALTMPIRKKTLVQEKYVLLLLAVAGGTVVGIPLGGLLNLLLKGDFTELLVTSVILGCSFLIVYAVVFPIVFKLGVEKARLMMVGIYVAIFVILYGVGKLLGQTEGMNEADFFGWLIPLAMVLAAAVVTAVSYFWSLKVIEQKE